MTEIHEIIHNEKMKEWQERVIQCQNSGLSINEWCRQNKINRKTYFYWQRQVWDNKKNELKQTGSQEKGIRRIRFAVWSPETERVNSWLAFLTGRNVMLVNPFTGIYNQITSDGSITKIIWE